MDGKVKSDICYWQKFNYGNRQEGFVPTRNLKLRNR